MQQKNLLKLFVGFYGFVVFRVITTFLIVKNYFMLYYNSILSSTISHPSLLLRLEPNLNQVMVLPWLEPTLIVLA